MAVKTQRGRLIQKIPSRLNQRDLVLWQGKRGVCKGCVSHLWLVWLEGKWCQSLRQKALEPGGCGINVGLVIMVCF